MGRIIGLAPPEIISGSSKVAHDLLLDEKDDPACTSPYTNIQVVRNQTKADMSSRPSLTADKRPKQKVRKPSKEFLNHKSGLIVTLDERDEVVLMLIEESELSTDDLFWSKQDEQATPQLYPVLPKLSSPLIEQKALTPSTPIGNISPVPVASLRSRSHNFISRNILIPEMCCVVSKEEKRLPCATR
jgi:hypothetical protein